MRKYWLILQAGLAVAVIRFLVRVAPLPRVLRYLHSECISHSRDRASLEALAYYTDRWLTLFPANAKGNCFPRSLTLYRFARRLGFPVSFLCGVRRAGPNLEGHAWLMLNGVPFLEPTTHWTEFAVSYTFPSTQGIETPSLGSADVEHRSGSSR